MVTSFRVLLASISDWDLGPRTREWEEGPGMGAWPLPWPLGWERLQIKYWAQGPHGGAF